MSAQYYYAVGSEQKGPFSIEQLAQFGLRPETLVWREGMPNWQRLDATAELAGVLLPPPPEFQQPVHQAPQGYPHPGNQAQSLGYDSTGLGPGAMQPASGSAIAAMVLGICSFVLSCVPYVSLVTFVTAILAIVFGVIGNNKANRREAGGKGMAMTGLILGIVYLVLAVVILIIVLIFGLAILGAAASKQGRGM